MAALLVVEECLDRATDRHPLWLDRIFRRVDQAFRCVAVFYRVRNNLGFLPAPGSSPISGPRDRQLCREAIWGSGIGARNDPRVSGSPGCGGRKRRLQSKAG